MKNREDEAGVLQNIGIIYEDEKNTKMHLDITFLHLKSITNIKDSLSIATMYLNLGSLYEDQGGFPRSLDYYNRALPSF